MSGANYPTTATPYLAGRIVTVLSLLALICRVAEQYPIFVPFPLFSLSSRHRFFLFCFSVWWEHYSSVPHDMYDTSLEVLAPVVSLSSQSLPFPDIVSLLRFGLGENSSSDSVSGSFVRGY